MGLQRKLSTPRSATHRGLAAGTRAAQLLAPLLCVALLAAAAARASSAGLLAALPSNSRQLSHSVRLALQTPAYAGLQPYCVTQADVDAAPRHRIFVASTVHDAAPFLPEYFQSLADQEYPYLTVVLYDDASNDGSAEFLEEASAKAPFTVVVLGGTERKGPAFAKWELIKYIRGAAEPMDLVLFLDGDDKLFRPDVLAEVDAAFRTQKPWFAYGRQRGYFEEQCGPVRATEADESPRSSLSAFQYCHPRIMRAFLLAHFQEADFQTADGRLQDAEVEGRLIFKALELAGNQVAFLDAPAPHVYYRSREGRVFSLPAATGEGAPSPASSMQPAAPVVPPIHIITCVFKRISLLRDVLHANIEAQDTAGRPVYLHVCNNGGAEQQAEVRGILEGVRGLAGYRLRTFSDNPGGYARFLLMRDAMREFPVDYFMMLDDDIMLPPRRALLDLMAEARPQEYNSWWGRHFEPFSDYYFSTLTPGLLKAGSGSVTKFHYAGTGLSVVDADIARFYMALIDKVPDRYRYVEDLWLSYVAHQLGWDVRRIKMAGVNFLEDPGLNKNDTLRGFVEDSALWRTLKDEKSRMLEDLRACGWNV